MIQICQVFEFDKGVFLRGNDFSFIDVFVSGLKRFRVNGPIVVGQKRHCLACKAAKNQFFRFFFLPEFFQFIRSAGMKGEKNPS